MNKNNRTYICAHCLYTLNAYFLHYDYDCVDPSFTLCFFYQLKGDPYLGECYLLKNSVLERRKVLFKINGVAYVGDWKGFFNEG